MYEAFYNLKEKPFNLSPDHDFLFLGPTHQPIMSYLKYGVQEQQGFIVITGEIGSGKTTLCKALISELGPSILSQHVGYSNLTSSELFATILDGFGIYVHEDSKVVLLRKLRDFLQRQFMSGVQVVLIFDEAQNFDTDVLEDIRLLSNFETGKAKLLTIALVGQPELREKINSPQLRQLKQRISVRHHITPMNLEESGQYIYHRLSRASYLNPLINFNHSAVEMIYRYAMGIPRVTNVVCEHTLLAGYARETTKIDAEVVQCAVDELVAREVLDAVPNGVEV
jgi:general secretion pathway protein A